MKASRRLFVILITTLSLTGICSPSRAEPSASDFIGGTILRIDAERGTVALRHEPILFLHLPAATTVFRYTDARIIIGRREGDVIRFRADRVDMTLMVTAILLVSR